MSTPPLSASSNPLMDPGQFEQAFKLFSLETQRLEMTYQNLQERFQGVQQTLQETHTRLSGKLAELDFTSRYLETILNHISQGILFIDLNGIVTTCNAAAEQILQIPEKEILFYPYHQFFDDLHFGFSLQEAFSTKKCPKGALFKTLHFKNGAVELEVEATFVLMSQEAYPLAHLKASSLPIQGMLLLLRDITKLRRLQQAAAHSERLKDLGELTAHLAHEVRNPLGGIRGFAALLQQELKERPDLQQMASSIVQGADDLNQFVSEVLQYSRPFQLHIENVNVLQLIEELKQLMQVDEKWNDQINFIVQNSGKEIMIPLDIQHFKSALLNLFVNAEQAMPKGGTLTVKVEADGEWAALSIEDTGEGISPENLPQIFSPFFTTKDGGTGLGLAEVKKVIEAHHGSIDVCSEPGKGTQFCIKIPRSE